MRPGLVAGPGLEGGDELALVDQPVLQREQAEEQVAVGDDGGHGTVLQNVGRRPWALDPRRWETLAGPRPASVGLSHDGPSQAAPPPPNGPLARPSGLCAPPAHGCVIWGRRRTVEPANKCAPL